MENNEDKVLSGQIVGKEYQIPELVDLNGIGEVMGGDPSCKNGSGNLSSCAIGSGGF